MPPATTATDSRRRSSVTPVWLYHRFCLSFRDTEDLLAQPGITVSYDGARTGPGLPPPEEPPARRCHRMSASGLTTVSIEPQSSSRESRTSATRVAGSGRFGARPRSESFSRGASPSTGCSPPSVKNPLLPGVERRDGYLLTNNGSPHRRMV